MAEAGGAIVKEYPLEIQRHGALYYSKGHHDRHVFAGAVAFYDGRLISPEKVHHGWRRWITPRWNSAPARMEPGKEGEHGVFPVTVWED